MTNVKQEKKEGRIKKNRIRRHWSHAQKQELCRLVDEYFHERPDKTSVSWEDIRLKSPCFSKESTTTLCALLRNAGYNRNSPITNVRDPDPEEKAILEIDQAYRETKRQQTDTKNNERQKHDFDPDVNQILRAKLSELKAKVEKKELEREMKKWELKLQELETEKSEKSQEEEKTKETN